MAKLKKRAEFLAVAKGARSARRAFVLQTLVPGGENRCGSDDEASRCVAQIRIGYTVTKKTGNSPERNRIKRRLRAAWEKAAPVAAKPGCDYVLIGRRFALRTSFGDLVKELTGTLRKAGGREIGNQAKSRESPTHKG